MFSSRESPIPGAARGGPGAGSNRGDRALPEQALLCQRQPIACRFPGAAVGVVRPAAAGCFLACIRRHRPLAVVRQDVRMRLKERILAGIARPGSKAQTAREPLCENQRSSLQPECSRNAYPSSGNQRAPCIPLLSRGALLADCGATLLPPALLASSPGVQTFQKLLSPDGGPLSHSAFSGKNKRMFVYEMPPA